MVIAGSNAAAIASPDAVAQQQLLQC